MIEFDLSKLMPRFECLGNGEIFTSDGITALFVAFTIAVFATFLVVAVSCLLSSRKKYRFYRKLVKDQNSEKLLHNRRDLKHTAKKEENNKSWPELWNEFDETLVEADGQLKNTSEAAVFFNSTSLAGSLVGNRLLAAGPGIITGIGVLGTFLGLQLGLGHLALGGETKQMVDGIGKLVSSASIAFTTSVCGVLFSLVFNFIEKSLERHVKGRIRRLQRQIDELFPRFSASELFVEIRNDGRESRKTLQGLAEKIGDRMQEAVSDVSTSIQTGLTESLSNVLAPAVDRMVDAAEQLNSRQAEGSEEALRSLIEKFTDNVGKEGDQQRQALADASSDVREALSQLGENMSSFFKTLEGQQGALKEDQSKRTGAVENLMKDFMLQQQEMNGHLRKAIEEQQSNLRQEQQQRDQTLDSRVNDLMQQQMEMNNHLRQSIEEHQAELRQEQDQRSKELEANFSAAIKQQKQVAEMVQQTVGGQMGATESLIKQGESLSNNVLKSNEMMNNVATDMDSIAGKLKDVSGHLEGASGNLGEAILNASTQVSRSADIASKLIDENVKVSENVNSAMQLMDGIKTGISESTELLNKAAGSAREGYKDVAEHYRSMQGVLEKHVNDLEKELSTLLTNYTNSVTSQTSERLNEWNKQTQNYTQAMSQAVDTIGSVVEEIEGKVGRQ
ncbi:anti-phage ZorAB system protein ZorA [Maridesulfovibrio ferrireducens]|uniref:anti-phage ZorAB system protein ZorA n=1 Tax=Maridesulfovibrio ferrireducens TaxID=246191 RepID=UPI001A296189|nr:anti-phage ZorAB system protein ZorA [Maridesulfovibrio ferrireducens]MBI9113197.1 anti-phage defense ZorAB system ZorA [Maridesulfovibrio ferrireducens]